MLTPAPESHPALSDEGRTASRHVKRLLCLAGGAALVVALLSVNASLAFANTTPKFVYVVNDSANNISAYTIEGSTGVLTLISGSPFAAGTNPLSVAADPSGRFLYVANYGSGDISAYSVNGSTGVLTAISGSPFQAGTQPWSVAVDSSGEFVYVANQGSSNISAFTINSSTGALTAVAGSPFADGAGTYPESVAIDPSGKFVYAANNNANNVSVFAIDRSSGALTAINGSPFGAGTNPLGLVVDPTGKFVYVANTGPNPPVGSSNVSAFSIDSSTGALTPVTGSPFEAGMYPRSVAVDPSGKFAYAANEFSNNVSAYTIDRATGALTAIGGSPFAGGTYPSSVAVDPSGNFLYVADQGITASSGNVSAYTIDGSTGALTPIAGSPFGVGFVCGCGDSAPVSVAIVGQSTVPFAAFKVAAEIDLEKQSFDVAGEFTLGPSSNGINPVTQAVTLQVGTFSTTIPAGSFRGGLGLTFAYNGIINGVQLDVVILNIGDGRFLFAAQGIGANLTGTVNPVTVEFSIGDNYGRTTVNADIDH